MSGAWGASLDQLWHALSPTIWVVLAVAAVFVLFTLVALIRADKSLANTVLAVLAVLAAGTAVTLTIRSPTAARGTAQVDTAPLPQVSPAALACLDGLAGDAVEAACERPLFASAESAAAAVSYSAAQMTRLSRAMARPSDDGRIPPELSALRRTLEHDRYGMVAHILAVRDGCTPADCAFYAILTDHNQIAANMAERAYEGLIGRYALSWNSNGGAAATAAAAPAAPPMIPGVPTGRPVSGDFPSSSSIPPVNIMTTEPGGAAASGTSQASKPAVAAAPHPTPPQAAAAPVARKPAPKKPPVPAPLPLAPAPPGDDNQQ